jgi:hypothetical protein
VSLQQDKGYRCQPHEERRGEDQTSNRTTKISDNGSFLQAVGRTAERAANGDRNGGIERNRFRTGTDFQMQRLFSKIDSSAAGYTGVFRFDQ